MIMGSLKPSRIFFHNGSGGIWVRLLEPCCSRLFSTSRAVKPVSFINVYSFQKIFCSSKMSFRSLIRRKKLQPKVPCHRWTYEIPRRLSAVQLVLLGQGCRQVMSCLECYGLQAATALDICRHMPSCFCPPFHPGKYLPAHAT